MSDVLKDNFLEYNKINTIFERDMITHKINEVVCRPEFDLIKYWNVQEKIDGMNMGVGFVAKPDVDEMWVQGRGDNAQIPGELMTYIKNHFSPEKFKEAFPTLRAGEKVIVYGEGCGPGIQKVGGMYGKQKHLVVFDVLVGTWWLTPDNVKNVAEKFGCSSVPIIMEKGTTSEIIDYVKSLPESVYAQSMGGKGRTEGVVCKTVPQLFMRTGEPLVWKLKCRDFTGEK